MPKNSVLVFFNTSVFAFFTVLILLTSSLNVTFNESFMAYAYSICMMLLALASIFGSFTIPHAARSYKIPALLLSLALLCTGVGEFLWLYFANYLDILIPYPSLADVWFVLFYPITLLGLTTLLVFLSEYDKQKPLLIKSLNLAAGMFVVVGILLTIFLIDPSYVPENFAGYSSIFDFVYVVCDALLLMHIIVVAFYIFIAPRSNPTLLAPIIIVGIAMIFLLFADSLFAYTAEVGLYTGGGYVDLLFIISTYLSSLAIAKLVELSKIA